MPLAVAILSVSDCGIACAQDAESVRDPEAATHADSGDYVTDLDAALKLAKKTDKKIILYTGHNFHLSRRGIASPRIYFDTTLVKSSPSFTARRSEFIVCERFEFTAMHDAKGNFTPEYAKFIKGWFGNLDDRYDIRFLTPTLTILNVDGKKLAGPIENFAGFDEAISSELKKIPTTSR